MTLCFADITSKNKNKVHRYTKNLQLVYQKIKNVEERDKIRNWRPPIDGDFIMKKLKLKIQITSLVSVGKIYSLAIIFCYC